MHRTTALVLAAMVALTAVPHAAAASTWTLRNSGSTIGARFISDLARPAVRLELTNRTAVIETDPLTAAVLKAIGLDTGYSQTATWQNAAGPAIRCPTAGITWFCSSTTAGGKVVLVRSIRGLLVATAPTDPGTTPIQVATSRESIQIDLALAAVAIALDSIGGGLTKSLSSEVLALAFELYPEAAGLGDVLDRGDCTAAAAELRSLATRAAAVIIDHAASWGLSTAAGKLYPGSLSIQIGIAVAKVTPSLLNLARATLTGRRSSVNVGYGEGTSGGSGTGSTGGTWARTAWEADWRDGLGGWAGPADWKTVDGVLVNDGTGGGGAGGSSIVAPHEPPGPDYAVEAEIQLVRFPNFGWMSYASSGVIVRGDDTGAYAVGFCGETPVVVGDCGPNDKGLGVFVDGAPIGEVADPGASTDRGWHTYRIEVDGNEITLLLDGADVQHEVSNRFLTGTRVGLWSSGAELDVRAFRVLSP